MKALCSERYEDWQAKFGPLGLRCAELTGDSQLDDYFELQNAQIVMTTPVSHNHQHNSNNRHSRMQISSQLIKYGCGL